MKYIAITQNTMTWELSEQEFESDEYQSKLEEYVEAQKELASMYGMNHLWSQSHFVQKAKHSIDRCSSCNEWTVDRETNPVKDEEYDSIRDGAAINDKLLCYECLPTDHRWSWT